jgi:hypothetical protein
MPSALRACLGDVASLPTENPEEPLFEACMTVRLARLNDAPAIANLSTQLGYPSRPEETEARLRDILDRADGAILIADEEGAVDGWLQVAGTHYIDSDPFALITGLVLSGVNWRYNGRYATGSENRVEPGGASDTRAVGAGR